MIIIRFKSNVNFLNDSEFIPMTTSQEFITQARLIKNSIPPLSIIDNWDGEDVTVQSVIWDGYHFHMNINESQTSMMGIIASCKDIIIEDTTYNLKVTLDTSSSDFTIFEISEKIGNTSNYAVVVNFRSNKKYINLKEATDNVNYIKINTNYYYNDNVIIPFEEDAEFEDNLDNNGVDAVSSSTQKKLLKFVYYYNYEDRNTFKKDYEGENIANITAYNGTSYPLKEKRIIESEQIGKDFYKLEVNFVIDSGIVFP